MDKVTTTIKRDWLREIVAGSKKIEYREGRVGSRLNYLLYGIGV
jgi:hypothetical protein